MDPSSLAMMYAMNVGIEALQGKRGSNLWKDAFKDTALMASMQGFAPKTPTPVKGSLDESLMLSTAGGTKGVDVGFQKALSRKPEIVEQMTRTVTDQGKTGIEKLTDREKFIQGLPQWEGQEEIFSGGKDREGLLGWFDKAADVFKSPEQKMVGDQPAAKWFQADGQIKRVPMMHMRTDPMKVGLGAGALGTGLYAAGMFDPGDPPEAKYPGYNKFYAQDPSQFMPYDDPNIDPIDYSKYPDKPYSGIKKGGIIGLQAGGPPPAEMSDNDFALMLFNKPIDQLQPHQLEALQPYLQNKKEGGIAAFAKGGRASNQPHQDVFEATKDEEEERRRQRQTMSPPDAPRIPYEQDGGIGGYGPGRRAMPEGSYAPTPQVDPRWFHPDNPRFLRPDVQGVKTGALIHRLPSKTKVDENNPKNYKRTSGKLVVDSAGKGSENKDTMLAQLADGEFVTKSKAVRGAGLALGADPKNKKQQKDLGARYFYKQMAEFDKLAKQMAS